MRSFLLFVLLGFTGLLLGACGSDPDTQADPCKGVVCERGQDCVRGQCVDRPDPEPEGCQTNEDCLFDPAGEFCERQSGRCVACFTNAHCPDGRTCKAGRCEGSVCTTDDDCGADAPYCNESGTACLACLRDDHCGDDETCIEGACVPPNLCETDEDCDENAPHCVDGACVACTEDGHCPDGQACALDGSCRSLACGGDEDCSVFEGRSCRGGECRPGECDGPQDCPAETPYCQDHVCVRCTPTEGCAVGEVCVDGSSCEPQACEFLEDCPVGAICEDERCVAVDRCEDESECLDPRAPFCMDGHCVVCDSDASCGPWEVCQEGECVPFATCGADAHCSGGFVCEEGGCVACRADTQCPRGACVNGICAPADSCTSDAQCMGGVCVGGSCRGCAADGDCRPGHFCEAGACVAGPACGEGAICPPGEVCDEGACVPATCDDDGFEPDAGPAAARPLPLRSPASRTICPGEEDWFVFQSAAGAVIDVSLLEAPEDVELALVWFSADAERRRFERKATGNLIAGALPAAAAGRYYVVVRSSGESGDYVLLVEPSPSCRDGLEPNDTAGQARAIESGRLYEGLRLCGMDHYQVEVPAGAEARFFAFFDEGTLDIQAFHDGSRIPGTPIAVPERGGGRALTIPATGTDRTIVFRLLAQGSNPAPGHYAAYVSVEGAPSCGAEAPLAGAGETRARVQGTTAGSRLSLSGACGPLGSVRTHLVEIDRPSRLVAQLTADYVGPKLALYDTSCANALACRTGGGRAAFLDVPELAPGTYVLAVAAGGAGGGWYDLGIRLDDPLTPPSNDLCEDSEALDLSNPVVVHGTTEGATSDFLASCADFSPDVFYSFELEDPARVVFDLTSTEPHTLVLVEDACDVPHSPSSPCWTEPRHELELGAGTYRLGVLATFGRGAPFDLGVQIAETPSNDRCQDAIPILASGPVDGDTTWARNDSSYDIGESCTGYLLGGNDVFYSVGLSAGQTITVTVTPEPGYDVAVYVRESCAAGASCLEGVDAELKGGAEVLDFTAPSDGTYLIVVDGAVGGGAFQIEVR